LANIMARTPIKKVNVGKEKIAVIHVCSQTEAIKHLVESNEKLSIIITGNGNPETGLCRQVALINERQHSVLTKLDKIDESINTFHEKFEEAKGIAVTAQHAINQYKEENILLEEVKVKTKAEKRADVLKNVEISGIVIAAIGLILTAWFSFQGNRQSKTNSAKIENLGVPVIVNPRGVVVPLPAGDQLKMFPRDFDTTKKDIK
jgi:hypothetical protein